jgi:hypothetical protein
MKSEKSNGSWLSSLLKIGNEIATMKRYKTCDKEEDSFWKNKPAAVQPWFVHWSIMWGFIGLLIATVLDFMLKGSCNGYLVAKPYPRNHCRLIPCLWYQPGFKLPSSKK